MDASIHQDVVKKQIHEGSGMTKECAKSGIKDDNAVAERVIVDTSSTLLETQQVNDACDEVLPSSDESENVSTGSLISKDVPDTLIEETCEQVNVCSELEVSAPSINCAVEKSEREQLSHEAVSNLLTLMEGELLDASGTAKKLETLESLLSKVSLDCMKEQPRQVPVAQDTVVSGGQVFPEKFEPVNFQSRNVGAAVQLTRNVWEEVHLFFKHLSTAAGKSVGHLEDQSENIKSLVKEDACLFYERLQSILLESAIELRVKILDKAHPGEEFVINLLKSYDALLEIGNRMKPHISPLETSFLSQIETSWDLIVKHFFYKCIFTDTRVHVLMQPTVSMLGSQEEKIGLVHELYKLDDTMAKVSDKWQSIEEKLRLYNENQLAVKLRRRLLQDQFKKAEEERKRKEQARETTPSDDDIASTMDYLVTRPRGLACRNASLQDIPPHLCERCGIAQCPCAECIVGHLLTCSLELEPEDQESIAMAKQLKGTTMPLEERMPRGEHDAKPQTSAELIDLLTQFTLVDDEESDSDEETQIDDAARNKSDETKENERPTPGPDSLMKLASAKFREMQKTIEHTSISRKNDPQEASKAEPREPPKRTLEKQPISSSKTNTGPPTVPPKLHQHGANCSHDKSNGDRAPAAPKSHQHHHGGNCSHGHSDDSSDSESEPSRSHCDCCHCDGTSVIRNAAMARRYPAIRQRLRNVLERRRAEKLTQQQVSKAKLVHQVNTAVSSPNAPSQTVKPPAAKPVNLVKGTPQVIQPKPPQPVKVQPPSTKPQQSQKPVPAPAKAPSVPKNPPPKPAVQQKTPMNNVQTATPPKDVGDEKSAKIAELIRVAQQDQQQVKAKQPVSKEQPAQKGSVQQQKSAVQASVQKISEPVNAQPEGKGGKKNKKKGGAEKQETEKIQAQPSKAQASSGKAGPQHQANVAQSGKGNKKDKGKKGKEPPPPPPPPEPKPKSEIDQLLEFIEGEEEKPKEEKIQPVESTNEKKAAKKARQKERKQAEYIAKQIEQEQDAQPAQQPDPNGMVRIVHDPVTQRAVITPVQQGFQQVQPQPPYPYMAMGGGPPMYNQFPNQYQQGQYPGQQGQYPGQQGQYPGHGYYPPMYPQMYPGMQQQGYGGYQQQQQPAPIYQPSQPAPVQPKPSAVDSVTKSQGPMVTLRRVVDNGPESKVTVTLRGEQPDRDKVLFTLVNGHVREPKGEAQTSQPQVDQPSKKSKKKQKNAAKQEQQQQPTPQQYQPPPQPYPQMPPQYSTQYPPFQPQMMPIFPVQQPPLQPVVQKASPASKPKPTMPLPRQKIQTVPLDDQEDFDIKSLKLPPGITVTRVLHQEGYRDPIFPQVSQMQKPAAVVQPSPQPNIIVVDTRDMTGSPKGGDAQGTQNGGSTAGKKKKKKRAGNSRSGQGQGEETWDADSIFAPKENPSELDETERELEAFKRFCLDSRPADPGAKLKVNLNVKDIFSRAKNGNT